MCELSILKGDLKLLHDLCSLLSLAIFLVDLGKPKNISSLDQLQNASVSAGITVYNLQQYGKDSYLWVSLARSFST